MRQRIINDEDRRQWVLNDEGLYCEWRGSRRYDENGRTMRGWIKNNRAMIDAVINNVTSGAKPAHYLRYGG